MLAVLVRHWPQGGFRLYLFRTKEDPQRELDSSVCCSPARKLETPLALLVGLSGWLSRSRLRLGPWAETAIPCRAAVKRSPGCTWLFRKTSTRCCRCSRSS